MKKIFTSFVAISALVLPACDTLKDLTTASNNKPVINSFDHSPKELNNKDEKITFTVVASDRDKKDILEYKWSTTKGTLSSNTGEIVSWSPLKANGNCDFETNDGIATVSVLVSDGSGGTATGQTNIRVEKGCKSGGTVSDSTVVNNPTVPEKPSPSVTSSATPTPNNISTEVPSPKPIPSEQTNSNNTSSGKSDYVPAKISFVKMDIKEINGNSDNVPNKGETIQIKGYFTNIGGVNSNKLRVLVSSNSLSVQISTNSNSNIPELKPNEVNSTDNDFTLTISKTIQPGTEIPLVFKLSDDFGNEYSTTGSFIVK